jgi:hypothetical protein
VDVGQHTTLADGDVAEQTIQLLVVANSELKVTRNDAVAECALSTRVPCRAQDASRLTETSCCHARRCQPVRGSRQRGIRGQRRGRLETRHSCWSLSRRWVTRREGKARLTRRAGTDTLGIVTSTKETVDTADGELETSFGRARLGLGRVGCAGLATFSA